VCARIKLNVSLIGHTDKEHAVSELQYRAVKLLQRDLEQLDASSSETMLSDEQSKRLVATSRAIALVTSELRKDQVQREKADLTPEDQLDIIEGFFTASSEDVRANILAILGAADTRLREPLKAAGGYLAKAKPPG
jgi:hypothetical protein